MNPDITPYWILFDVSVLPKTKKKEKNYIIGSSLIGRLKI